MTGHNVFAEEGADRHLVSPLRRCFCAYMHATLQHNKMRDAMSAAMLHAHPLMNVAACTVTTYYLLQQMHLTNRLRCQIGKAAANINILW